MPSSDPLEFNATPGPLFTQIGEHLRDDLACKPRKVFDPSAGAGVAAQRLRRVFRNGAIYYGLETRCKEKRWIKQHFDRWAMKPWINELTFKKWGRFDLISTNPPFPLWVHFAETLTLRLEKNGYLAMLGLQDWGSRNTGGSKQEVEGEEIRMRSAVELFDRLPPRFCARIPGTVSFRQDGQRDTRSYCWWIWEDVVNETKTWETYNLPLLPAKDRRWIIPPGKDEIIELAKLVESKNLNGRVKRAVKLLAARHGGRPRIIGAK